MKKTVFMLLVICLPQVSLKAQTQQDSEAIRETVLDYIEGWYTGDSARMGQSLHTELAKWGIVPSRDGKGTEMMKATYHDMVNWTLYQKNRPKDVNAVKDEITIHVVGKNIASVTCVSKEYIDYLHLTRTDKGWKILNVLWEPNYKELTNKQKE